MARKPKDTSHLRLRIDPIRLAKLEKQAEKNGRTITGEITHRLDVSFQRDDFEQLSNQIVAKVVAALKGDKK
jgi:hypothetical protein